jgi:hypothetical protein
LTLIFPYDEEVLAIFGRELPETKPKPAKRKGRRAPVWYDTARAAYRGRLQRAQDAGILPPRRFISSRRWGWDRDEFMAAMAKLPTTSAQAQDKKAKARAKARRS